MPLKPCYSCRALVCDKDGPTHKYLASSPGCWAAYGQVLEREYSDATYAANHRLTVDAYAAQHPGHRSSQTIQSVSLHLVSLHLVLERSVDQATATARLARMATKKDHFKWLEPPISLGDLTVNHVLAATSANAHRKADWAHSVWQAWEVHHAVIRRLAA